MSEQLLNAFVDAADFMRQVGQQRLATRLIELSQFDDTQALHPDDLNTILDAIQLMRETGLGDKNTEWELSALVQP